MKKVLLLAMVVFTLGLTSCKDDEYKAYEGTWAGTYSGGDEGVWRVNINSDGEISGEARASSFSNVPFTITGNVSTNGQLNAEVNIFIGTLDFTGHLSGNSANGVWENKDQNISGTWTGTKQ
jgi:hypothetical protein